MEFTALRESFERACAVRPPSQRFFRLAPGLLRLRVAGPDRLSPAFEHLAAEPGEPDLRVDLWDTADTGVPLPVEPCADPGTGQLLIEEDRVLHRRYASVLAMRGGQVYGGYAADRLSLYERGRPLHRLLSLWHNHASVSLVHAAMVAWQGRGLLLGGNSGSGKTTSALECLLAGFDYLGDDLVALEVPPEGPCRGHSVYGSTFFDPLPGRWPWPREVPGDDPGDKSMALLPHRHLLARAPIGALLLPRILRAGPCRLIPASAGEALVRLAPSSLLVGATGAGQAGLDRMARLVERTPAFWLELGDAADVPRALRELG